MKSRTKVDIQVRTESGLKYEFFCNCFGAYLREKIKIILLLIVFAGVFALVFFLYHINLKVIIYPSIVCSCIGSIYFIVNFLKFYKLHKKLCQAIENIIITMNELPPAKGPLAEDYMKLIEVLFENQAGIISESAASKTYMSDYYAMWVHQIKVPISAMHLLMSDMEKNSPLRLELFKIEQYVEMALSYVRLESDYTDYVLREYNLDTIVKQAVRKYAPLFISKKIGVEIAPIDTTIITDEKWLQFVIEQILSNSLKYTKKGTISIYSESPATLVIKDTGIGIAPEDIKRIGEKGFTGYNGRKDKKSTGLGLYLCKEVLERLCNSMSITSEVDKGTTVSINLERRDMIME